MRIIALIALSVLLSCSGTSVPEPEYDAVLEVAEGRLKDGDAAGALSTLRIIRFRTAPREKRRRCQMILAECHGRLTQHEESLEAFWRARHFTEDSERTELTKTALGIARESKSLGHHATTRRHLMEALAYCEDTQLRDRLRVRLAETSLLLSQRDQAKRWLAAVDDHGSWGYKEVAEELGAPAIKSTSKAALPKALRLPRIEDRRRWDSAPVKNRTSAAQVRSLLFVHEVVDTLPLGEAAMIQWLRERRWRDKAAGEADLLDHFVIDAEGRIWEGRGADYSLRGRSARRAKESLSILVLDSAESPEWPTQKETSLVRLVKWLESRHELKAREHRVAAIGTVANDDRGPRRLARRLKKLTGLSPR